MKRIENSEPIDVSAWTLHAKDRLKMTNEALNEALTVAFEEKIYARFPHDWNVGENPQDGRWGKLPGDPLTIYVDIPLGEEDREPTWQFSLAELVDMTIDLHLNPTTGKIEILKDE